MLGSGVEKDLVASCVGCVESFVLGNARKCARRASACLFADEAVLSFLTSLFGDLSVMMFQGEQKSTSFEVLGHLGGCLKAARAESR